MREAWDTGGPLPACACGRPAGICGMAEVLAPGRRAGARPGRSGCGSPAPRSSRARSTPRAGRPPLARARDAARRGRAHRRDGFLPRRRPSPPEGGTRRPEMDGVPPLPGDLRAMLEAVRRAVGRPRLVGGGVRDWLLGLAPKDFDVEVAAADFEGLRRALWPLRGHGRRRAQLRRRQGPRPRGAPSTTSASRGVSRRPAPATAGLPSSPIPGLGDAEAAARRDFTVNAIAIDPFTGAVIDPFDGEADLRARILRHTGPAFTEDPLRVLRAFQLASRFDFTLAPETAALCREMAPAFAELPLERVWGEWDKWAVESVRPSRGLAGPRGDQLDEALPGGGRPARHAAGARLAPRGRRHGPHGALPRRPRRRSRAGFRRSRGGAGCSRSRSSPTTSGSPRRPGGPRGTAPCAG